MNKEIIPYFEDEASKLRPNLPIIERNTINAILWDQDTNNFLCLDWKKFGWGTFIIGGMEEGENEIEAAMREISEETGYAHTELVANLGKLKSGYFAAHKGENRIAHTAGLLFKLKRSEKKAPENSAVLPHIAKWIPKNEVKDFLTLSSQTYLWNQAQEHIS